jgi:hypothetical protein
VSTSFAVMYQPILKLDRRWRRAGACVFIALRWARKRWSIVILCAMARNDASGARTSMSISRKYVRDGADAATETRSGETPLHGASLQDLAWLLAEDGADAAAQTRSAETSAHRATE